MNFHIPEDKKDIVIKILCIVIIILFAALVAPYLVDYVPQESPDAMSAMMQKTFDIPSGTPVPTIAFTITRDTLDGYDLHVTTTNFTFTPQNINQAPVVDQGHVHLYIDGALSVVFGDWYHIPSSDLPPGKHTIVVSLNANDHSVFWANGQDIEATTTFYTY